MGFRLNVFKPGQMVCRRGSRQAHQLMQGLPSTRRWGRPGELGACSPLRSTPQALWGYSVGLMGPCVGTGVRGSLGSPTSQGVGAHHGEDRAIRSNRPERHRQPRKDLKKQDTEQKEK